MTVENIWSNRTFENVNTGLRRSANSFVIMGNPITPAGGAGAAGVSPDGIALAVAGPTPAAAAAGGSVELANAAVNQGSVTALGALSGLMTVGRTVEMRDGVAHMTTSRVRERNYRTIGPAAGDLTWGSSPYSMLLTCATVCNRARFAAADPARPVSASQRLVLGDASDTALFRYCDALRPVDTIRSEVRRADAGWGGVGAVWIVSLVARRRRWRGARGWCAVHRGARAAVQQHRQVCVDRGRVPGHLHGAALLHVGPPGGRRRRRRWRCGRRQGV
jgi:hypothetical protein